MEMPIGPGAPGMGARSAENPLPMPAAIAGVIVALVACALPYGFVVPAAVVAIGLAVWSFRRPVVAVAVIVGGQMLLLERTETITVTEIAYGVYFFGFLAWWFSRRILIDRDRIIDHPSDGLLLAFLVFAALSVVPALALGAELIGWFREYLTIATLFLYFPLRAVMNEQRGRHAVFAAGALLVTAIAIENVVSYGMKAAAASFFWELLGARQAANAHFLFPAFIALGALAVHLDGAKRFAAALGGAAVFAALLLTFARGFWLGAMAGGLVVFLLSPGRVRSRMLRYGLVVALVAASGIFVFGGDFSGRLLESLGERLLSSGKSLADISLRARFIESEAVLGRISSSPVIGNGIGAKFTFNDVLKNASTTTAYVHNGYLFLAFKVGVVGAGIFLAWLGSLLRQAWRSARKSAGDRFNEGMITAAAGVLVGLLLINITSNVVIERASLLVMAFFGALVVSNVSPYPARVDPE